MTLSLYYFITVGWNLWIPFSIPEQFDSKLTSLLLSFWIKVKHICLHICLSSQHIPSTHKSKYQLQIICLLQFLPFGHDFEVHVVAPSNFIFISRMWRSSGNGLDQWRGYEILRGVCFGNIRKKYPWDFLCWLPAEVAVVSWSSQGS